jgi:hypothetical protein
MFNYSIVHQSACPPVRLSTCPPVHLSIRSLFICNFVYTRNDKQMELTKSIFWDVDMTHMDAEKHAGFIIIRVLQRGTMSDWNTIKERYGLVRVREVALQARFLDDLTLNFCSAYFHIPKEQFRCYTLKQSIPMS